MLWLGTVACEVVCYRYLQQSPRMAKATWPTSRTWFVELTHGLEFLSAWTILFRVSALICSAVLAKRPTALLALLTCWLAGILVLFDTTMTMLSGQLLSTTQRIIAQLERWLLVILLVSTVVAGVKYAMAKINAGVHRRFLLRRLNRSDRLVELLAMVVKRPEELVEMTLAECKQFLSDTSANVLAETIVERFDTPLTVMHLKRAFPHDAEEMFAMFKGESASIAALPVEDVITAIEGIQAESRILQRIDRDNAAVGRRLEVTMLVFALMIVSLVCLMIVHTSGYLFAIQAMGILTSLGYMTEDTAKRIYQCFMFAFVQHPVDIGDVCVMEGVRYKILRIYLLNMECLEIPKESDTGDQAAPRIVDMSVSQVATKNISNVTRSKLVLYGS